MCVWWWWWGALQAVAAWRCWCSPAQHSPSRGIAELGMDAAGLHSTAAAHCSSSLPAGGTVRVRGLPAALRRAGHVVRLLGGIVPCTMPAELVCVRPHRPFPCWPATVRSLPRALTCPPHAPPALQQCAVHIGRHLWQDWQCGRQRRHATPQRHLPSQLNGLKLCSSREAQAPTIRVWTSLCCTSFGSPACAIHCI